MISEKWNTFTPQVQKPVIKTGWYDENENRDVVCIYTEQDTVDTRGLSGKHHIHYYRVRVSCSTDKKAMTWLIVRHIEEILLDNNYSPVTTFPSMNTAAEVGVHYIRVVSVTHYQDPDSGLPYRADILAELHFQDNY